MDILTNNIKVKYQTHDRIYLVIEEDWNNRTGKLNKKKTTIEKYPQR